jgi:hypothetical protein
MKKMILKESESDPETKSILLEAKDSQKSFVIWQWVQSGEFSFKASGKMLEIAADGGLELSVLSVEMGTLSMDETFFATDDNSTIFKSSTLKLRGKIISQKPSSARYRDRRKHARIVFKGNKLKDVEVRFGDEIIKSKLVDISEGGACFLVSKSTLKHIEINSTILLKSLTSFKIDSSRAKVVNARNYNSPTLKHEEFYAIGVVFY